MRRSFTLIAPIATGAVVLTLALAYPASAVRGSFSTGPKPPRSVVAAALGPHYLARWTDHDRAIRLHVRDGNACRPRLEREASTGPARVEVMVSRPSGPICRASPRWWDLRLQPPVLRAAWQPVDVYVNGDRTVLGPPRRAVRHHGTVQ